MDEVVGEINFDDLIKKARHPSTGVMMKNRNGWFSTAELTFIHSDFSDWIQKNYKVKNEDANKIILKLNSEQKIIPKSTTIDSTTLFTFSKKIQITIVGGGLGGCKIAIELFKSQLYEITLISENDFVDFLPNVPKLFGNKEEAINTVRKSYKEIFKGKINVIIQKVTKIEKEEIQFSDGTFFNNFDIVVLSLGSHYDLNSIIKLDQNDQKTPENIVSCLNSKQILKTKIENEKIKDIVVIGAGPAGIEIFSELCYYHKDKNITLINSRDKFLESMSVDLHDEITSFFSNFKNGIVLHDERVQEINKNEIITKTKKLDYDLILVCTGNSPNTECLKNGNLKDILDSKNFVKVNEYLQAENNNNIFVIGDITNIQEQKMYAIAIKHGLVVGENIKSMFEKKPLKKHKLIKKGVNLTFGPEKRLLVKDGKIKINLSSSIWRPVISTMESLKLYTLGL
eukprot:gene7267-11585_t